MEDPEAKKVDEVVETEETVVAELFIETPEAEKLKKPSSNRLSRLYLRPPKKKLTRLSLKKPSSSRLSRLYLRPLKESRLYVI